MKRPAYSVTGRAEGWKFSLSLRRKAFGVVGVSLVGDPTASIACAMALVGRLEQALQVGTAEEARRLGESWLKESAQWWP